MVSGSYSYTPYIWPMLVSAIFSAILGVYVWRHRAVPGASPFAVQLLFFALWALFTGVEMAATPSVKPVYYRLEAMAGIGHLSALLYFALVYAGPGKWATRRSALVLSLVAVCLIVLAATNDLHHLVWTRIWFDGWLRIVRGPLNPLFFVSTLLLPVLALLVFLRLVLRSGGIYRQQALMLLIGTALPFLTFMLEPAGINPVAPLDPVILVWNVSLVLYALAIFRFRMLGVAPIGRDTAVERMTDGVLVLDASNRIADLNPAAGKLLSLSRRAAIGRPAEQVLAAHPELSRFLEQETPASVEIALQGPTRARYIQVQASPLIQPGGFHLGRLILLEDVTEQHRAREQLLQQQRVLAALEERAQLAQELHDSLSQGLAFLNLQAQAAQVYLQTEQREASQATIGRMAQVSGELQADLREYISNLLTVSPSAGSFCETLRQVVAHFVEQNALDISLDIDDASEAQCSPTRLPPTVAVQLVRIVQEALANVRKHAGASSQVGVCVRAHDGKMWLAVSDNGDGFDPGAPAAEGKHFGLQVMRLRAARIGGQLSVHSAPGQGTCVQVCVPIGRDGDSTSGERETLGAEERGRSA